MEKDHDLDYKLKCHYQKPVTHCPTEKPPQWQGEQTVYRIKEIANLEEAKSHNTTEFSYIVPLEMKAWSKMSNRIFNRMLGMAFALLWAEMIVLYFTSLCSYLHAGALRKIPEENLDAEYIAPLLIMSQHYQVPYFKVKNKVIIHSGWWNIEINTALFCLPYCLWQRYVQTNK